jgi:hypothetical protein
VLLASKPPPPSFQSRGPILFQRVADPPLGDGRGPLENEQQLAFTAAALDRCTSEGSKQRRGFATHVVGGDGLSPGRLQEKKDQHLKVVG